ncbi:MAG TPA: SOS response-associated peptidase family protein [Desulfitobacteriaceae bacterium]|nr:SOS response-associated peptidase family protein [Desulfitobacteriaceae bacterium]
MCGRYFIDLGQAESEIIKIIEEVNDRCKNTPELEAMKTGEIFPTFIVPILTSGSPVLMKWGFSRFDGKGQVINARVETVPVKSMFRKPYREHRCLVPASYFFEWEKQGTKKQKYAIGLQNTLYMAGLYRFEKDVSVPLFVILTRPAAPDIAFIHDRMPVILAKDMHEAWLSQTIDNQEIMNHSVEKLLYHKVQ